MKTLFQRLSTFADSDIAAPVLLALMAVLAYGLLIPQLGFYWDDLPMSWIRYGLGPDGMARYFSTNRPVWGLLYQVTTRLLPHVPIYWQIFGLFWRWVSALLVWAIVRDLWPGRRQLALIVSLLFLVYPGFNEQWTSYVFSHFLIVLCFFLFSILCMLWSFRQPGRYWPLTLLALAFSALNLWMMEYFFTLELLRPFVILYFVFLFEQETQFWLRIRRAFLLWLPYLAVFLADVYWRLFIFNNQVYQPTLIPKIKAAPITASLSLIKTILLDLYTVAVGAWVQAFRFPSYTLDGLHTTLYYVIVFLLVGLSVVFVLFSLRATEENKPRLNLWLLGLGFIAMLVAGGPFWLTSLGITLAYPASRFTLPFVLGVSLFLAGLLEFLPMRFRLGIASFLIVLAAGRQALWADDFRRDWTTQKTMFWQMFWRAPGITPNTLVLLNDGAFEFYADNSLAGALNWIYDPHSQLDTLGYMLFYPTSRLGGTLPGFQPGQPVTYDFISEVFHGNTSQTLAFYFQPPGCLRLLDPEIDSDNHLIPDASLMRDAAQLSSRAWITPDATALIPAVYGPEPAHGWCYYFEKADLARQTGDWQGVVELGDQAFALNDYPNDPIERFVFVEGYAHEGNWTRAKELAIQSYKVSPNFVGPPLCHLLSRMEREIPAGTEKTSGLDELRTKFSCLP